MSDISRITKYLDVLTATKQAARKLVTKARQIKKVPVKIVLPATDFADCPNYFTLVTQFNYTVSHKFSIKTLPDTECPSGPYPISPTPPELLINSQMLSLAIRYRKGDQVFRYFFFPKEPIGYKDKINSVDAIYRYNGEVIEKNFVIEAWGKNFFGLYPRLLEDFKLPLEIYVNPSSVDQTEVLVQPSHFVRTELYEPVPEPLPTNYDPLGPWLDNP